MCMWCPIGILMMMPLGSSQQNSLQLCVTDSTDTTLQSHNLDSGIEENNLAPICFLLHVHVYQWIVLC